MLIVYITCSNAGEAKKIALALLKNRLIACANIVPKISSIYRWKGKIVHDSESLLLCKSSQKKVAAVKREVEKIHSYKVPCIEFIKVAGRNVDCKKWLLGELELSFKQK